MKELFLSDDEKPKWVGCIKGEGKEVNPYSEKTYDVFYLSQWKSVYISVGIYLDVREDTKLLDKITVIGVDRKKKFVAYVKGQDLKIGVNGNKCFF